MPGQPRTGGFESFNPVVGFLGGVLGVAVRLAVARVRMLGLIVFGGLLVLAVYRNFILGS